LFSDVKVEGNQLGRDLEVTLVEVVLDVPADLTEFLTLLNGRMEEGQDVDQGLEFGSSTLLQVLRSHASVDLSDVSSKTIWGLSDNLETLLQNTEREFISWLGGQPQSEVFAGLLNIVNNSSHSFKPFGQQMTIEA